MKKWLEIWMYVCGYLWISVCLWWSHMYTQKEGSRWKLIKNSKFVMMNKDMKICAYVCMHVGINVYMYDYIHMLVWRVRLLEVSDNMHLIFSIDIIIRLDKFFDFLYFSFLCSICKSGHLSLKESLPISLLLTLFSLLVVLGVVRPVDVVMYTTTILVT